jgi:ribosomal protein S18 acetylase RimI-like enzyme
MPHPFERRFKQKLRAAEAARFASYNARRVRPSHERSSTSSDAVTKATPADRQRIVDVMTRAYVSDPPSRFLYPELDKYMREFPRFVESFAGAAFETGSAFHVADNTGAALWLKPSVHPDDDALEMLFEETIPAGRRAEVFEVFEQMSNYHPAEPHWHLAMFGVDPSEVHRGYGSALLAAGLAQVDRAGQTAYLESTSSGNLRLYEKFGFKLVGTIDTGRCPPIFAMVRRPD